MSLDTLIQKVLYFTNASKNDGVFVAKVLTRPYSSHSPYTYYCYEPKKVKYFTIDEGYEKIVSETVFFEQYRLHQKIENSLAV